MEKSAIFGEKYLSRVAAEFGEGVEAKSAAERLTSQTGIAARQVRVIAPGDRSLGRKLEPESGGILRTLVKSHLTLGTAGLVTGIAIALVLIAGGWSVFAANAWYTLFVFGFFGAIAGLLLGGLVSLRPDHDPLIARAEDATRREKWLVLVHARNHAEEREARAALERFSDKLVATL